jgi:hypothetical protein
MLKRWWLGLLLLVIGVSGVSAQDEGSTLQAWADTSGFAFNLSQQVVWPFYTRDIGAISTYTASGDPTLSCAAGGHAYSVWATFVATQTGVVKIAAQGSNYDAVVAVFKTTPTIQLRCANTSTQAADLEVASFRMVTGTRYYVMFAAVGTGANVDTSSSLNFIIQGNADETTPLQIPASGSYSIVQSEIENAFPYVGSLATCGSVSHVVFYTFKPAVSGRYEFSTLGSSYDTTLAVAEDPNILACNRNLNINTVNSRLRPMLTAGHTYFIVIGQDTDALYPQTDDMVLSLRVRKL